jgi:uncharacterized membrane protein
MTDVMGERGATGVAAPPAADARARRLMGAGGLLAGVGLGGFVDGIVLHQVLQWHHLLTGADRYDAYPDVTAADLERNTLWDGIFHTGTWVATVVGLFLLWRAAEAGQRLAGRRLVGLLLAGWGLFNLVEGTVLHHVVGAHHVRDDLGAPLGWDLGFLGVGLALLVAGLALAASARRRLAPGRAGSDATG